MKNLTVLITEYLTHTPSASVFEIATSLQRGSPSVSTTLSRGNFLLGEGKLWSLATKDIKVIYREEGERKLAKWERDFLG